MPPAEPFPERVREFANRIAESGPSAMSGLFDLTSQRLHRYAVTITRKQHDADDVVQHVLLQIAGNPRLLSRAENPWHYLLQMVRNRSLWVVRERKKAFPFAGICDLVTRRSVDELELEDTFRVVWAALRKLPTEQSEVVLLKVWEELTFAQIGTMLNMTPSTAASRYRYAMGKLARHFEVTHPEVYHE